MVKVQGKNDKYKIETQTGTYANAINYVIYDTKSKLNQKTNNGDCIKTALLQPFQITSCSGNHPNTPTCTITPMGVNQCGTPYEVRNNVNVSPYILTK